MLLRVAALILFLLAALYAFGWLIDANTGNAVGCVALGLAAFVLSGLPFPYPPASK